VAVRKQSSPARPPVPAAPALFDLTPTDEQRMLVEVVRAFATERVRPAAAAADAACRTPDEVTVTAAELGISQIGVPEVVGGLAAERSAVTNVLVAEALARGDLGIAVACLAPSAVSGALSLWGTADQQAQYLPSFVGDAPPAAALAILEPRPAFDPVDLRTTAASVPGGYTLTGVKSLVPLASQAELFVVGADLEGHGPALFLVESGSTGLTVEAEPAMGLRAAGMGRLQLDGVHLPASALLARDPATGEPATGTDDPFTDCVRLSRLGWCALAVGTAQAVLDHVVPYVNERVAFGEPISHRQAVAFTVADIGIELDGMRLVTYRAAARAEQGRSYARETALARRLCSDKGMFIGSSGVQLLGGHGYVKEHPVERWYRDLRSIGLMEGVVLV
jgi:alkylation response protein AidB-like acyl-CoA dehydrogenase